MNKKNLVVSDGQKVAIALSHLSKKGLLDSSQVYIHKHLLEQMNNDFDELMPEKYNNTFYYKDDNSETIATITVAKNSQSDWHIVSNLVINNIDFSYTDNPITKYYLSKS